MVFIQRNFVADFIQGNCGFTPKTAVLRLEPYLGLRATYDDHLRLIGKRVVDFLLVLTELFSLGVTGEALRANIDWKLAFSLQRGHLDPKFQGEGVAPTKHSSCHKSRINDLSCGIRMWAQLSFVLSQITRLTDRRTDRRQTTFSWLDRVPCNACIAVKLCTICLSAENLNNCGSEIDVIILVWICVMLNPRSY